MNLLLRDALEEGKRFQLPWDFELKIHDPMPVDE